MDGVNTMSLSKAWHLDPSNSLKPSCGDAYAFLAAFPVPCAAGSIARLLSVLRQWRTALSLSTSRHTIINLHQEHVFPQDAKMRLLMACQCNCGWSRKNRSACCCRPYKSRPYKSRPQDRLHVKTVPNALSHRDCTKGYKCCSWKVSTSYRASLLVLSTQADPFLISMTQDDWRWHVYDTVVSKRSVKIAKPKEPHCSPPKFV